MSTGVADNQVSRERITAGALLRGGILALGSGFMWGWVWFSAIHAIPYFFLVALVVSVIAYGMAGMRLRHALDRYPLAAASRGMLACAGVALFYIGDRVLWFAVVLGVLLIPERKSLEIQLLLQAAVLGAGVLTAVGPSTLRRRNRTSRSHV